MLTSFTPFPLLESANLKHYSELKQIVLNFLYTAFKEKL